MLNIIALGKQVMNKLNRIVRSKTIALICSAGFMFQAGGCSFGEITTTTTLDGRELLVSLIRGAILTPLDALITDTINDAFADGN